ncbi:MAG TPA: CoA transferase [Gemmatimonadales bacterium]|nr:CoA transferase [Gemmatimonadales bacterium]
MSALAGLRVIELAHIMAGPVCGRMLADLGADVIKVEKLPDGDTSRSFLPPDVGGESAAFMMLNRNKRGIAVDLKTVEGQEIVRLLLRRADVVIENYRAGAMERLGLGYESLRRDNPGLVFCEISGYGRTGPMAQHGGFDLIAQGYSGLMSITGEGPGRPPVKCGPPITDVTAGIIACMGVLAALLHRDRTGQGQRVDTSLYEAGITQTYWQAAIALATGISPGPMGSAHPLTAPYEAFQTADGWITVGASSQSTWVKLTQVIGRPDLASDARFLDNADRMRNRAALADILGEILRHRPSATWLERLAAAGVPAGPVLSVGDMLSHPQTIARGMVTEVPHSRLGRVKTIGFPIALSETPADVRRGAPMLGEHTREVLTELGYSEAQIVGLDARGVIVLQK